MNHRRNFLPATALAAVLALGAGPVLAQAAAEHGFSEGQIASYAAAAVEVQRISDAYQPRIQEADSEAQLAELRQQAQEQMVSAVEGEGLDVETYNAIFQASQADPDLHQEVLSHVQQQ